MGDKAKNIIKKYSFALTIILLTTVIGIIILKEVIFN
jgi:hypothetical protein